MLQATNTSSIFLLANSDFADHIRQDNVKLTGNITNRYILMFGNAFRSVEIKSTKKQMSKPWNVNSLCRRSLNKFQPLSCQKTLLRKVYN